NRQNVICSSSHDSTIRFWDFKDNQQLQIFKHNDHVGGIEFSQFTGGRYLCFGSYNNTINLSNVEIPKSLHVSMDMKTINNKNDNKINNIGIIDGNGYTICSGSIDRTIRIWDIETTKQLNIYQVHKDFINNVKYGSNELVNTILSGLSDNSVRLWDIRSYQQIQSFNGHTYWVTVVEYSPFVKNNIFNSDVIQKIVEYIAFKFIKLKKKDKKILYMI
ncbi:WD-40 repeat protein, partial [Reticulomyxa filosa]